MIKGKDILGRNIVAISNGQRVDTVQDIIFDHQANRVLGLLVDEGGWFRAAKVVPYDRIKSIGEDAIMISTPEDVTTTRQDDRLAEVLDSKINLIGMALLTTDGQRLGRISDVYFDENTGEVEGYESTGGLFSDLTGGRTFVPAPTEVNIGADAAIVPISVAAAMEEQAPGGIKGVFHQAAESVKEGYQSAADSVKGTIENIADATKERQQEYVVGKTAGAELVADDGTVIVRKGETITKLHAEVAEWHGKLTALATNATGGAIASGLQGTASKVEESYQAAASNVKEAVGSAVDNAKERVQDTYEDVKNAAADRQKAFVTGKTANTDIRTDSGELIVARDAVITEHQAQRAEQTGKLAALTAAARLINPSNPSNLSPDRTAAAAPEHDTPESAIGRRARTDVRTPAGSLVAAQGQIITPSILQRAQHVGAQQALLDATKPDLNLAGAAAGASAAVTGGLASVSEGASNLLEKAKGWLSDKRDEAEAALQEQESALEEQRIKDAVGHKTTRAILTKDDHVILEPGTLITHQSIEDARKAGMLDVLLDSVDKTPPSV